MKTKTSVAPGIYRDETGAFWCRPWVNRRRTWRKLKAVRLKAAATEAATLNADKALRFSELARLYLDANCPNRRLEPRPDKFAAVEDVKLRDLLQYFGTWPCDEITLAALPAYAAWRRRRAKHGPGHRTVDLDLVTLSNVLSYGTAAGQIEANLIRSGRPRYCRPDQIRHSREVAPESIEAIHKLAARLLETEESESLAWQLLFATFTGCRTSELLRLRLDAPSPDHAGLYMDGCLFLGRRSKGGTNPWAMVGTEFEDMLRAFRRWHKERHPASPWYFPGRDPQQALSACALGHALRRKCRDLKLPHITPHGLRSFYVTKRRSDGISDVQIAGEIGDQTVSLLQTTYGARPSNWLGGDPVDWLPKDAEPAWAKWKATSKAQVTSCTTASKVDSKLDYANN